jgi:hypothetical protein
MAQPLYSLLTATPFRLPNDPGDAAVYVRPVVVGAAINPSPLTQAKHTMIVAKFNCQKH